LTRSLNPDSLKDISDELKSLDLSILNTLTDVKVRWSNFKTILINIINSSVPLKKKPLKKNKPVPWFDSELYKVEKMKSKLYNIYRSHNNSQNWELYLAARRSYQKLFKQKRIDFYSKQTINNFPSSKKFWEFYSSSISIKSDHSNNHSPNSIEVEGNFVTENDELASCFNKHFISLGNNSNPYSYQESVNFTNNLFRKIPDFTSLNSNIHGSFDFTPVTPSIMDKLLSKVDASSSPGYSGIPSSILKTCHLSLAPFFTQLFNDCVRAGLFPDEFKLAIVTPLFKNKGSPSELNNYRGISSLSPLAKVFEKIMAEQIKIYFEINKLFFSGQHGFRPNHSCESALHELISKCNKNNDNRLIYLLLFIDFKKAFDMIDQKLLLIKLLNYGFSNSAIRLLSNYFHNRKQQVKIGSSKSTFEAISLGVPQGSILGPLLFLIFINDLPFFLNDIFTKLFADDTTLLFSGESVDECVVSCQFGIEKLAVWCDHNNLYVNWSKTFLMFVTHKRCEIPLNVVFNSNQIEVVSKFKLLGTWLDSKLNFDLAASELVLSINRKLYAIKRIFYLSNSVKLQFFKTFILPFFDFGLSLMIYFSQNAINKLSKAYYNCIFKLFHINCTLISEIEINSFLRPYNLWSFQSRLLIKLSCFAFNILKAPNSPTDLKAQLIPQTSLDKYTLRDSTRLNFVPERSNCKYGDLTFKHFYVNLFNKIPLQFTVFDEFLFNQLKNFKQCIFGKQNLLLDSFLSNCPQFRLNVNLNLYDFYLNQKSLNTAFYKS